MCEFYHIRFKNHVFTAICAKGMRKGSFTLGFLLFPLSGAHRNEPKLAMDMALHALLRKNETQCEFLLQLGGEPMSEW